MSIHCSPLIQVLSPREQVRLLDRAVPRTLGRGDTLYLAGDDDRRVHFVAGGMLKLCSCDHEGRETIVTLAVAGDVVGETAAADLDPHPFDVTAATTCDVIGVDADLFIDVITTNPAAARELARLAAVRIRWIAATAGERTTTDVPSRLAGRLLDLAELLGRMRSGTIEVDLPLTQTDVGQLAGMCRESASKTLSDWKRRGVLEHNGKTLRIFRPDALERIRCGAHAGGPFPSTGAGGPARSR